MAMFTIFVSFFIWIYSCIRSYNFLDTNIFEYLLVSFFYLSNIPLYPNFTFVTPCSEPPISCCCYSDHCCYIIGTVFCLDRFLTQIYFSSVAQIYFSSLTEIYFSSLQVWEKGLGEVAITIISTHLCIFPYPVLATAKLSLLEQTTYLKIEGWSVPRVLEGETLL